MDLARAAAAVVIGYLFGALPWALWVGRAARGVDVREHGSGNLGATNVYRVLGPRLGLTVLGLDAAKGFVAASLGRLVTGDGVPGGGETGALLGAIAAVLGHMFTIFAGFRGGKGVATAAGAMLAVAPAPTLGALGVFAVALAASRRVSAASVIAALVWSAFLWLRPRAGGETAVAIVGSLIAALLVLRHVPNLRRLARGEEPAFEFRSPPRDAANGPPR